MHLTYIRYLSLCKRREQDKTEQRSIPRHTVWSSSCTFINLQLVINQPKLAMNSIALSGEVETFVSPLHTILSVPGYRREYWIPTSPTVVLPHQIPSACAWCLLKNPGKT